jgi:hypothetical protein
MYRRQKGKGRKGGSSGSVGVESLGEHERCTALFAETYQLKSVSFKIVFFIINQH